VFLGKSAFFDEKRDFVVFSWSISIPPASSTLGKAEIGVSGP
jgi:hypothetical protein